MYERQRSQAEPRMAPEPRRSGTWMFGIVALMLLGGAGYLSQLLADPAAFPIRKVTVEGDFRYLAPAHIQTLVSRAVQGGFFQVDVQAVRLRILDEPWVYEARVQRMWPDAIRVSIDEQQPVAYWGDQALLNQDADMFVPSRATRPRGLVHLHGPVGAENEVLATYRDVAAQFAGLPLEIASVTLSERRAWTVGLRDGAMIIIGRHAIDRRLARFTRAYKALLEQHWQRIAVVDLRYTNGFAIRERDAGAGERQAGASG